MYLFSENNIFSSHIYIPLFSPNGLTPTRQRPIIQLTFPFSNNLSRRTHLKILPISCNSSIIRLTFLILDPIFTLISLAIIYGFLANRTKYSLSSLLSPLLPPPSSSDKQNAKTSFMKLPFRKSIHAVFQDFREYLTFRQTGSEPGRYSHISTIPTIHVLLLF